MGNSTILIALLDIINGLKASRLASILGWQDVRQRYQRSTLGPFWLTITMGVMVGTIGVVFGKIFKSPMDQFLPFLAAGLIFWGFISSVITEGCMSFIAAEGIIKQLPIPLFLHVLRMIWRNFLIFCHNILIFPVVLLFSGKSLTWAAFLVIPGLVILLINLTWMALLLAIICTRYRDLPQIIASLIQILFYLTPVIWLPSLLPQRAGFYLLDLNPAFHLLEIVRAPLLGSSPSAMNWSVLIGLALVGWGLTIAVYGIYKRRIAYWL